MADRKYPLHVFWGAGEPDCPEDLKAANGELIDMRCKVCGDGWLESHDVCMAALKTVPDAERLCRALRQFVKLVPAGDECRLQLTVGAQSFFIGIEPMPEDEAAHFAGLFVLALAGMVQQVTTGVKVRPSAIAELRERIAAERNDGVQGGSGVERMEQALRDQETHFEQVYASGVALPFSPSADEPSQ